MGVQFDPHQMGIGLKEVTNLRHFFENIVNNFLTTVFHSLFRNTNYFPN